MNQTSVQQYVELFENLTPDSVTQFESLVTPDVRFADPFNDVRGFSKMCEILTDMFERSEDPSFTVFEWFEQPGAAYVRWEFRAKLPVLGVFTTEGVSRLSINESGLIAEHLDYWDSAPLYMKLPLLGRILRSIRAKMALPS
ncbi:SnoaL-like domain protein [Marinobacterium sp. xm-d-420]|uniref:nuclear transport factor 2 family protein n=1 Tax=Marinobacterium sp. xm-d-420 TaxID=2497737 RepID=UPI0015697EA8|nr:nuclear transport factor 2 family protein [Marinobacterium sp. xm-d-420]NRP28356.1 SnoaL-like domain protein [Marinobacterium sp. xm-d-420]